MVWVIIAVALYLLILFAIAWISLHPFRIPIFLSPGGLGCSQEDIEFTTSDGILLRGWFVDASKCSQPRPPMLRPPVVAILSHGYMMNRSELSPLAPLLASKGISSIYYDFRAHGRSNGKKSFLGYREKGDVAAAAAFARSRFPGCKIVLMGSSMGAAASALAAGDDPSLADALVLDCAYSRLPSAVIGWWRFLGGPVLAAILSPTPAVCLPMAGFNPYKIDVAAALGNAGNLPVLFFHGDEDTLALPSEATRNQEACTGPTKMVWLAGCGHAEGRWLRPELYNSELLTFLDEYVLNSKS
jgi:pimeloyl-ACP methyl ester carboxylesterase